MFILLLFSPISFSVLQEKLSENTTHIFFFRVSVFFGFIVAVVFNYQIRSSQSSDLALLIYNTSI